jgi:hypothetical protein
MIYNFDIYHVHKFLCFKRSTDFANSQRDNNSHAQTNDSIITNECDEELNEEIARTTKKKNDSKNTRRVSAKKENIVALDVNQDRPKRIRKTPDRLTY